MAVLDLGNLNTTDSAVVDDGGGATDSGEVQDGTVVDASEGLDASEVSEGGITPDASEPIDAGVENEGGVATDAGSLVDAGPACDFDGAITRAFVVRTLRVAPSTVGADVDGLDNSSTPTSVAGCRKADATGGIENALAGVDTTAMKIPSSAMQSGLTSGTIALTFTVSNWNGTANDDCIDLSLSGIGVVGGLTTRTSIAGSVIDTAFAADTGWDITGSYANQPLTVPLRGFRAHLVLDGTLTELVLPTTPTATTASFIAGYVLYADAMAPATGSDLRPRVIAFVNAIGYGAYVSTIDSMAMSLRDLHTVGGLRPCMNPGVDPTVVDADSLSAALLISSNPP